MFEIQVKSLMDRHTDRRTEGHDMSLLSANAFGLDQAKILLALNSLPKDTILRMFEFKASADYKFGVAEIMEFVFGRLENVVGKGDNAGYQHFLLFSTIFSKCFLPWIGILW